MYIRSKKNKSGSVSVQIISKDKGKYLVVKSLGVARNSVEETNLKILAKEELKKLEIQTSMEFLSEKDCIISTFLNHCNAPVVVNIGPELILGKIFNTIGFKEIPEGLFKHITLARLTYPVSKLKTTDYLLQHKNIEIDVDKIYRFLDKFHKKYKRKVEDIVFNYSKSVLGKISIMFYDMTTLYFEAEDEDDLRKIGFSKDGKFQCPQIMLGLIVGEQGYPIAYNIYEGNTFEGKTIIPMIKEVQNRYNLPKPTIIADSGLLSTNNVNSLSDMQYEFILGARIKNETDVIKQKILEKSKDLKDKENFIIHKSKNLRLIVSYSIQRAKKDKYNREKGLRRLKQKIQSGKITKEHINNRGYNKFLILNNEVSVRLDESKIQEDEKWDGLKGYITNHKTFTAEETIANYNHLWKIEKAFRISKTDLRIRPVFHRKRDRIEAHICIAFAAYAIYKELERRLEINSINISPAKAIELSKTIFEIEFSLPDSKEKRKIFNYLSDLQKKILNM